MTDKTAPTVNIESEMREAYLSYAMSVIVSRALPDARDGLKPVHRRILYAMHDMGIGAGSAHKKSARIVGEVLGKYHPHGDGAVYETMVRMAQDFSMRYMLIDGQGNFGSIDGDGAAAMRYTEARMADIGGELLADISKDTVDFVENFDGALNEPAVLPAMAPNLLINGASGIAVGMSTNIPPHNLGEICDALVYMLEQWGRLDEIDVDELMQFVKGPDFPTGGVIYKMRGDEDMLRQAMASGRGKITLRAKVHIEEMGRGKSRIIVSELPYQTNKTTLIERIASLARSRRLEGLDDLRDESDRQNTVRLVIELKRDVDVTDVLVKLFKLTPLQSTFGIIMLALVDGQPRLLSLKHALRVYLEHRLEVIARRSRFDLARAQERAHVLEGLLTALEQLDAVIQTIRKSRNSETARNNLIKNFKVSEAQASAILEMPLRRLASLERRRIRQEYKEKQRLIKSLEALLASPQKQRTQIAEELAAVKRDYGDARRSIIADSEAIGVTQADFLMPEVETVVMLSARGQLGRTRLDQAPKVTTATRDPPRLLQHSTTAHIAYLFADDGSCATLPVQQAPQVEQAADGMRFSDLTALSGKRRVVAIVCLPADISRGYICFVTARGQVKRLQVADLPGVLSHDFSLMKLSRGDRVVAVLFSAGSDELILASEQGNVIRFSETDVRPTGASSGGVRGMNISGERVAAACIVAAKASHFWFIDGRGYANAMPLERIRPQARGGKGSSLKGRLEAGHGLAAIVTGRLTDTIHVLTSRGKAKKMTLNLANTVQLGPRGIEPVIALNAKESVVAAVEMRPRIEEPEDDDLSEPGPTLEEIEQLLDAADRQDEQGQDPSSNGADPALTPDA